MPQPDSKLRDTHRKTLGRQGEDIAVQMLKDRGFQILGRNIRGGHAEMDIVCLSGEDVRIVEVKTRQEPIQGEPWEAVDAKKQRHLVSAAQKYLHSDEFRLLRVRYDEIHFDVVTLVWDEVGETCRSEYIPDAFIMIYT